MRWHGMCAHMRVYLYMPCVYVCMFPVSVVLPFLEAIDPSENLMKNCAPRKRSCTQVQHLQSFLRELMESL